MLKIMISLAAAAAPALFLVKYFYRKDKLKPEPLAMVIKIFIAGIIVTVPVIIVELLFSRFSGLFSGKLLLSVFFDAFIIAAFTEEFFKLAVVKLFVYHKPEFDEETDGIIYCIISGLGFACMENILYVFNGGLSTAFIRAFTAIPLHALSAGIMGYYIGKAKFSDSHTGESMFFVKGLFLAVLLHGIYDFILMASPAVAELYGDSAATVSMLMVFPLLLTVFFILKADLVRALKNDIKHYRV